MASQDQWLKRAYHQWLEHAPKGPLERFYQGPYRVAFGHLAPWLARGGSLLDLGCGEGHHAEAFRRVGMRATGLDADESALARARESHPECAFVLGDAASLPFDDESFDVVFSRSVLQYVDHARALAECRRVLRPGGRAVFLENLRGSPAARLYRALRDAVGWEYPALLKPRGHLGWGELEVFEAHFEGVRAQAFNLATVPLLAVPEASERPRPLVSAAFSVIDRLDQAVLRWRPELARFGWIAAVCCEKPAVARSSAARSPDLAAAPEAPPAVASLEPYPHGRRYAVAMTDDTDLATVAEVEPVYALLDDLGLRSTRTVWPLRAEECSGDTLVLDTRSATLEDRDYRRLCERLHARGFELAMHTASAGDNTRRRTLEAYDRFEAIFGAPPATNVMHCRNRENLYWGRDQFAHPALSGAATLYEPSAFEGHVEGSRYYWADVCRARTRYVRTPVETLRPDTLAFDPSTPFHDPRTPGVRRWFSATYASGTRLYSVLDEEGLCSLREGRGAAILHVYLRHYATEGAGSRKVVRPRFRRVMERLASAGDAWVVPAATLLDRLVALRALELQAEGPRLTVTNRGDGWARALALSLPSGVALREERGEEVHRTRDRHGQVLLGDVPPGGTRVYLCDRPLSLTAHPALRGARPSEWPRVAGMASRLAWQFRNGRRAMVQHPAELPWVTALDEVA